MSITLISSVSVADFKKANNVDRLDVCQSSKTNKLYVALPSGAFVGMVAEHTDLSKPLDVVTVTDGTDTWAFIAEHHERNVVNSL